MWDTVARYYMPMIGIYLYMQIFQLIDSTLIADRMQKPFYAVHALYNAMIAAMTASDVWNSFTQFNRLNTIEPNYIPIYVCYSFHLYLIMYYRREFDWIRHGLFIGVVLPLFLQLRTGPLLGCAMFFTTGLPGAIHYGLRFAECNGWIACNGWSACNGWIKCNECNGSGFEASFWNPAATLLLLTNFTHRHTVDHAWATGIIATALYVMHTAPATASARTDVAAPQEAAQDQ